VFGIHTFGTMQKQNYKNHIRFYPAHHYIFYPVAGLFLTAAISFIFRDSEHYLIWAFISIALLATILLSLMLRQHYALMNQNRIVRLELRFRYYVLTHQRFEDLEQKLSQGQLFALRFASDEELPALAQRALKENLSADAIKQSIKNWLPDEMRV
jgi:hypothetical protein